MHESLFAKHPEYAVVEDNNSHFPIKLHFSEQQSSSNKQGKFSGKQY